MTNILQHKSWHVWNRDNRAKVEKDVAEHKEAEEKKRKRVLEIEQEIRYNALKEKNQKRKIETQEEEDPDAYKKAIAITQTKEEETEEKEKEKEKPKHINFFAELEAANGQVVLSDKNADYEAEKKEERDKEDRRNTNYLVAPKNSDFVVPAPWYAKTPTIEEKEVDTVLPERKKDDKEAKEAKEAEIKKKRDERLKNKEDPLQMMNKYLGAKKTSKKIKQEKDKEETKSSNIAKLREERLKREQEERKKVSHLLYGDKDKEKQKSASGSSGNSNGYNSSFLNYSGGVVRDAQYRSRDNNHRRR